MMGEGVARSVRIGGAGAFFDDSFDGHRALLRAGVDYLVYDYLAEVTMAILASDANGDPAKPRVDRFVAPGTQALNFVVHDSLGGGASVCARVDIAAKTMAQMLLEFPVPAPRRLLADLPEAAWRHLEWMGRDDLHNVAAGSRPADKSARRTKHD